MGTTTIVELPLYTDLIYRYGAAIEGQQKQFTFYWNNRVGLWHMDIRNEDQTVVVLGVPLIAEYPMLVDHPMLEYGLTGYFVLLPSITGEPPAFESAYTVVPENFKLYYNYVTD